MKYRLVTDAFTLDYASAYTAREAAKHQVWFHIIDLADGRIVWSLVNGVESSDSSVK